MLEEAKHRRRVGQRRAGHGRHRGPFVLRHSRWKEVWQSCKMQTRKKFGRVVSFMEVLQALYLSALPNARRRQASTQRSAPHRYWSRLPPRASSVSHATSVPNCTIPIPPILPANSLDAVRERNAKTLDTPQRQCTPTARGLIPLTGRQSFSSRALAGATTTDRSALGGLAIGCLS